MESNIDLLVRFALSIAFLYVLLYFSEISDMVRKFINTIFRRKESMPITQELIDGWEETMRSHRQKIREQLKVKEEIMMKGKKDLFTYDDKKYIEKLGKREEWIRSLDTVALIKMFQDKHSGNVSLIRQELQDRYKSGRDRDEIATAFRNSIVSDQQWVLKQEKRK